MSWEELKGNLWSGGDSATTACVNWQRSRNQLTHGYTEGYRRAAAVILAHVRATNRDQDFLVFPFVMMWRQCIELQLKHLIGIARLVDGEDYQHPVDTHDLLRLWRLVRPKLVPHGDVEPLDDIERHLTELCRVDPGSFGFRFPYARDLVTPSIGGAPTHINLEAFDVAMSETSALLGGVVELLQECHHGLLADAYRRQWEDSR